MDWANIPRCDWYLDIPCCWVFFIMTCWLFFSGTWNRSSNQNELGGVRGSQTEEWCLLSIQTKRWLWPFFPRVEAQARPKTWCSHIYFHQSSLLWQKYKCFCFCWYFGFCVFFNHQPWMLKQNLFGHNGDKQLVNWSTDPSTTPWMSVFWPWLSGGFFPQDDLSSIHVLLGMVWSICDYCPIKVGKISQNWKFDNVCIFVLFSRVAWNKHL